MEYEDCVKVVILEKSW